MDAPEEPSAAALRFTDQPAVLFYPKFFVERWYKVTRWALLYARFGLKYLKVERDKNKASYTDTAMQPVTEHDEELEMFQSADAVAYLKQEDRLDKARHGHQFTDAAE